MAHNPAKEAPLAVRPSEEGLKRRQAEFLLLYYLDQEEIASKIDLKTNVKEFAKKIAQSKKEPPIYFNTTSGRAPNQDREFNEVLDRCLRRGWIERTLDEKYGITDKGKQRVGELESEDRYQIGKVKEFL